MATPPDKRLGVLLAQDGNRWVLTVGGYLGEHAPTDARGFMEAVRELPTKDIYQVVSDAEILGEPVPYTFPINLRRRYDKLGDFPDGYLVIGDALCNFNPIYGQGMTVAALEAQALDSCLAKNRGNLSRDFFTKASKIIDIAWDAAVGTDLSYPEVEGERTAFIRFINWYIGKLHIAAQTDSQVSTAFLKVINMLAPPPSILHPRIIWRVIKGNLQQNEPQPSATQLPLSH
jgi:2-polyprenyl-6-methoxyphenol hydroxylase-like FAD-dependent oxidoreductase